MKNRIMKVRELKKFLEATDDEVEVSLEILSDDGWTTALLYEAEDSKVGEIRLKGYV